MTKELEVLASLTRMGAMSRRDFMGRASALGVSAAFAGTLLGAGKAAAQPVQGKHQLAGPGGGAESGALPHQPHLRRDAGGCEPGWQS